MPPGIPDVATAGAATRSTAVRDALEEHGTSESTDRAEADDCIWTRHLGATRRQAEHAALQGDEHALRVLVERW